MKMTKILGRLTLIISFLIYFSYAHGGVFSFAFIYSFLYFFIYSNPLTIQFDLEFWESVLSIPLKYNGNSVTLSEEIMGKRFLTFVLQLRAEIWQFLPYHFHSLGAAPF